MNKTEAIKATRNGAIAACISALLTALVVIIAIKIDSEGSLALWNDPANFFDVVLMFILAFGIYKKSRVASMLLLVYFIASKIIITVETQAYSGIGLALVFLYFYIRAAQGAFVYHRLEKVENPDYQAAGKASYMIGIPLAIVIVALTGFALMSTTGIVPSTRVQSEDELNNADVAVLRDSGIVDDTDRIKYFYSQGLASILESGNVLTHDRVILYFTDENGELLIYEIPLREITDVVQEQRGDAFSDSVYVVNTADPDRWLRLFLSVEQKGDQKFVNELRSSSGNYTI